MSTKRIGATLAATGAPVTLIGAAMYALPGPGLPFLVIGLVSLTTGLAMLATTHSEPNSGHSERGTDGL
ncbi:hypothetical protein V1460_28555 [Streptomyces sp. SCSIO 30461]|uniref:hypothetical protein n=1 Tax=Streptomyces sp. SCSIO 30461 TaxID=3118085 RepID=UPI0030D3D3F9